MTSALWISLALHAAPGPGDCTLALTGGQVWQESGFIVRDIAISTDGYFIDTDPAECAQTLDISGQYVTPPFGEGHTHNIEPQWLLPSINQRYLAEGVFYVLNGNAYASAVPRLRPSLDAPGMIDVSFAMGGLTSYHGHPEPVYVMSLSTIMYGGMEREGFVGEAFHTIESIEDIAPALDRLQEQGADFVKIYLESSEDFEARHARMSDDVFWTDALARIRSGELAGDELATFFFENVTGLDPDLAAPIVDAAHERGLRVLAHVGSAHDFSVAMSAGVDGTLHMPGAYFAPGEDASTHRLDDEAIAAAANHQAFVIATTNVRPEFVTDETRTQVHQLQAENIARLRAAGVPVLIGTDRWNETSFAEVEHLVTIGALTPAEALEAWIATGPAIFPDRRIGRIAPEFEADFLVFSENPSESLSGLQSITHRIMGGEILAGTEERSD